MKAVILAGGLGRRLRPLTEQVPKPLVPILGKPIIAWQIEWLRDSGIREIIVCAGYLRDRVIEALGNGSRLGVRIGYVVEDEPLGTGGAIRNAEIFLDREEGFYVLNGDIITDLDPGRLAGLGERYIAAISLVPLPSPYGIVETRDSEVLRFVEKPTIPDIWINAGVYYMRPEALRYMPERGDLEETAFPRIAAEGRMKAVKYEGVYWKSIDTHKDLEEAERHLRQRGR